MTDKFLLKPKNIYKASKQSEFWLGWWLGWLAASIFVGITIIVLK